MLWLAPSVSPDAGAGKLGECWLRACCAEVARRALSRKRALGGRRIGYNVEMAPIRYRCHRFPPEIIQHAICLYLRFTLSYRDV